MADVISKRKKVKAGHALGRPQDTVEDVRTCIWPKCGFHTTSFKELEDHAVEEHNVDPPKAKLPKEERERRDVRAASQWALGVPEEF